jgi:L-alanine-DL-glutamate epimerase-like enolase superfamily enzyme
MIPTTITQVDATPLDMPLTEPFAIAKGAPAIAANVLVRIALADGTLGLGEAAPFTAVSGESQESSLAAIESVRSSLVGQDVRRFRTLSWRLGEALGAEPSARCAIETAALDAFTRHMRVPLWAFFGGRGTELDTDMTITAGDARHAAAAAVACQGRGIHALKIKVGAAAPTLDVARIAAVHRATPGAKLLADANGGYTPEQAIAFLDELRANQVPLELFEQPVEPERWAELAAMLSSSEKSRPPAGVSICADESVRTAAELVALVREGAVDAVNIKPMKSGVVEALAIWNVATAAGLKLMIGGMLESVLAMSFSANLAAGLGGFTYVDLDTPMFIREHPFTGGFEQEGARLSVARVEAGHGVVLA